VDLRTDLTAAMRSRDKVRSGTIRMVLTALTEAEVAGEETHHKVNLVDEVSTGLLPCLPVMIPRVNLRRDNISFLFFGSSQN